MKRPLVKRQYSPDAKDIYLTVPNLISLFRIVSIPVITALISRHQIILALLVLAISSVSDWFDGIIARTYNQVSKIGQILDPLADRLLIVCSALALSIANIIPWWVLVIVVLRDAMLTLLILVLRSHGYGLLPVHFVGKTATALLMLTMVALMISDMTADKLNSIIYVAGTACGIWGVALYWLAGILYVIQGVRLLRVSDR